MYGGFEQEEPEGWTPADGRVHLALTKDQPRQGKQAAEILVPQSKTGLYYSPGVKINPYWTWDCAKPASLRFSINARQRYLGYNLLATLTGKSETGEIYSFVFIVLQTGPHWTLCKSKEALWNPAPDFGKDISGFEAIAKLPRPLYCQFLPGLANGEWNVVQKKWVDFDCSLDAAFATKNAPPRPKQIEFSELKITGYIHNQTHYWLDAISLGEKEAAQ